MLSTDVELHRRKRSCADPTTSKRPIQSRRPTSATDESELACFWWWARKRKYKAFRPRWCSFQSDSERSFHPGDEKSWKLKNLLITSTQKCCCGQFPRNADAISLRILSIKTRARSENWVFHFYIGNFSFFNISGRWWKNQDKKATENFEVKI